MNAPSLPGSAEWSRYLARKPVANRVVETAAKGTPCPNGNLWRPSCKRRSCCVCGRLWARDVYVAMRLNLEAFGRTVTMIAITPPGRDRLPWDRERCTHGAGVACNGAKYGCRVQDRALREWSDTLSWRAAMLRKAAYQAMRRAGLDPPRWLERVWEPQKRGPGHLHIVIPYGTPAERRIAKAYADELGRLAPLYDFGFVQTQLESFTGEKAARYLARYLTGRNSKKGKTTLRQNIADPNLPASLFWITPLLSRSTHVTMRMLRRARHLWAAVDGRCDPPNWRGAVEAVKAVIVCRRVFWRREAAEGDDDAALDLALDLARSVDRALRDLDAKGESYLDFMAQREDVRRFAVDLVDRLLPAGLTIATA